MGKEQINKAMNDWCKWCNENGHIPDRWPPQEDIMKMGKRMEADMEKYSLTEDEWVTIETIKNTICIERVVR